MGAGAPGRSSARVPGPVEVESAPAADSAIILREYCGKDETGSGRQAVEKRPRWHKAGYKIHWSHVLYDLCAERIHLQ